MLSALPILVLELCGAFIAQAAVKPPPVVIVLEKLENRELCLLTGGKGGLVYEFLLQGGEKLSM